MKGNIGVTTENIFPVIKKFLYSDHDIFIREIIVNAGSEMIVAIAGKMMRMPGLPKTPQAEKIDVVDGHIVGLS